MTLCPSYRFRNTFRGLDVDGYELILSAGRPCSFNQFNSAPSSNLFRLRALVVSQGQLLLVVVLEHLVSEPFLFWLFSSLQSRVGVTWPTDSWRTALRDDRPNFFKTPIWRRPSMSRLGPVASLYSLFGRWSSVFSPPWNYRPGGRSR